MANKKDAYRTGFDTGYSIAELNYTSAIPEDPTAEDFECFAEDCVETESDHYRQFSPFEFTAQEFNKSRNPDGIWSAYEDGVWKGIRAYIKERRKVSHA